VLAKQQGCGIDHSSLTSANVKNAWIYTATPQICLYDLCPILHRDNFTIQLRMEGALQTQKSTGIWTENIMFMAWTFSIKML
jgi:hypothetical protein